MSRGVNKVIIIGNLGHDPEVRSTPGGTLVARLSVATSESWADKGSGEQKRQIEWHRVVCFGRLSEIVGEYLRKGSKVYIEGSLRTRQWEKDGITKHTTEIIARDLQMLDGHAGGASADDGQVTQGGAQYKGKVAAAKAASGGGGGGEDFDDEVPF